MKRLIRKLINRSSYAHKVTRPASGSAPHSAACTCDWTGTYQTKPELDSAIANHAGWTM